MTWFEAITTVGGWVSSTITITTVNCKSSHISHHMFRPTLVQLKTQVFLWFEQELWSEGLELKHSLFVFNTLASTDGIVNIYLW